MLKLKVYISTLISALFCHFRIFPRKKISLKTAENTETMRKLKVYIFYIDFRAFLLFLHISA